LVFTGKKGRSKIGLMAFLSIGEDCAEKEDQGSGLILSLFEVLCCKEKKKLRLESKPNDFISDANQAFLSDLLIFTQSSLAKKVCLSFPNEEKDERVIELTFCVLMWGFVRGAVCIVVESMS
jgi:hypothetical protein